MANPLAGRDVTQAFGYASTLANVLGLNNWQMYPGAYNGVKFHLITSGVLDNLNRFNPAAGAISAVSGFLSKAGLIGSIANPTNDALPYGTSTVSKNVTDVGSKKYVRHRLPNSNTNVLEDLGWDGERIKCVGIMFGSSAIDANNNLFNVMINPQGVLPTNRNVLVHPIFGKISDVLLIDYKRIHSSEAYKAIAYEFTFETSSPVFAQKSITSILSQIAAAFNAIVSVYNAINQSINLATILYTRGGTIINNEFQTNRNNAVVASATLIGVTQLIYNNLTPATFVNPTLEALDTSTVNLSIGSNQKSTGISNKTPTASSSQTTKTPKTGVVSVDLSTYNSSFNTGTPNGVSKVVTLYAESVQSTIDAINNSGQASSFQSVIANLEAAVVSLNNVAQSVLYNLLENTTKITTKNVSSLEEIFAQYNIDFNIEKNIKQVLSLNPGAFTSVNFIPAGTSLVLPNAISQ
jgi:prophage DNA circulation protein